MSLKHFITDFELDKLAHAVAEILDSETVAGTRVLNVYPVPRGGVPAFYLIREHFKRMNGFCDLHAVSKPSNADIFIDDLVDSGKTRDHFTNLYKKPFRVLIEKGVTKGFPLGCWLVFPWEGTEEKDESATDIFTRLLQFVGEDPTRGGLLETPARTAKAWESWCSGYKQDPASVIKTFEDGAEGYDEMIHTAPIPFYSHCEHHMAPFFGTVQFAYIPNKRIVGLSKFYRLINIFARRLQVQERLTVQIVDAFCAALAPRGAACVVKARHMCMESRGIGQQGIFTTTSAMRGVFKEHPETRAEFFSLSNGH